MIRVGDFSFCISAEKNIADCEVKGLATDSKRCKAGFLFFCKGEKFKSEYAREAIERGAVAIICEKQHFKALQLLTDAGKIIEVDGIARVVAECAAFFYGYPMKKLCSVAVTGTKGKTTTASFVNAALKEHEGIKSALLTDLVDSDAPRLTTPEAIDFHMSAARALEKGCTHIVCEISSQAQKMQRTHGIIFDYACFLNLGNDHISPLEHKDKSEYFECKKSLFDACKNAIVNVDDAHGKMILHTLKKDVKYVTFSTSGKGDYNAKNIKTDAYGCDLTVFFGTKKQELPLIVLGAGEHNAENALCAATLLLSMGIKKKEIFRGILKGMPRGRGQMLESDDKRITVIVDYAHNEMSFEAMLEMAEKVFAGAIVTVVFGCPGGKAVCRRSELARVCAKGADKVIVCDDDSGDEGYESIKNDIRKELEKYCDKEGSRLQTAFITYIEDRKTAINVAIKNAFESSEKQLILILGKGDEDRNRVYGCDQTYERDINVAKKAIKIQNDARNVFKSGCKSILILTDGENASCESIARAFTQLREQHTQAFAVCPEKNFEILEEKCFFSGIAVRKITGSELQNNIKNAVTVAENASKAGFLPCFCALADENELAVSVWAALKPEKTVYLYENGGILSFENDAAKIISYKRALTLNRYYKSKRLALSLKLLRAGEKEIAFVLAKDGSALSEYALGKGSFGVIKGK